MKRCPKCECGAEFTNRLEYYAKHGGSAAAGFAAGAAAEVVHPHGGGHVAKTVYENMTSSVYKHYRCTNKLCKYEWNEK